jgi:hypothetical protein
MVENIKKRMEIMADIAEKLHNDAKTEGCMDLPDPSVWILNQNKMRESWEKYSNTTNEKMGIFGAVMLDNSFGRYMKFMYESYPPGFSDEIKKVYHKGGVFDGALTYYKLMNKVKNNNP